MADSAPSTKAFKLPEDLTTLSQMRDQLSDYLNTLERNTDAINSWLQKNQSQLIMGHHQLVRAIKYNKNEQEALQVLSAFGDAAGFVLSISDFAAMAEASFGKDSQVGAAIAKSQIGVPPKILEELPEIKLPDPDAPPPRVITPPPAPQNVPEKPAEKKKWWQVSSWFSKDEKEKQPDPEEIEAENRRREEELRRHWRLVRGELVSLQSDRHYYVDSFMNWIGENLAPESDSVTPNLDKLMDTYENPQYVIDLARADYDQVINIKAQGVREKAAQYSELASLIDEQKIGQFSVALLTLFPNPETNESKQTKEFLLKDFGAVSFADLALSKVKSRADQLSLLEIALKLEPEFKLTGLTTNREIFERIFQETTAAQDPLDSRALRLTLDKLQTGKKGEDLADLIGLKSDAPKTVFERLIDRFRDGIGEVRTAMGHLLDSLAPQAGGPEKDLTKFMDAAAKHDASGVAAVLDHVAQSHSGRQFMALWALSHAPGSAPLSGELISTAKNKAELSMLVDKALSAGILDEFRQNSTAVNGSAKNALKFLGEQVMAAPGEFSLPVARRLIAASFANGGLDQLRAELTRPSGWLQAVMTSKLPESGKMNWTAALLEPFSSDAMKANILVQAASAPGADAGAAAALKAIEANYAGTSVRLADGKIMTNLDRIANIWYNEEPRVMRYTVNGIGHTFMDSISPVEAREVLALIKRKGDFLAEYDGLYRPENIDRIATNPNGTKITWNRNTSGLNVDDATLDTLHHRDDFLHVTGKDGSVLSVNQRSIALLQPLSDGTHLLVDRYGTVQVLDGAVTLKAQSPLVELADTGSWINPGNASVLQINADKNAVDLRLESNDFDELLESAAPGQYFYTIELGSKTDLKKVQDAVASDSMIQAPGGKSLSQIYFNMSQLGYMMYTDARETGFTCRKHGPTKKPGFISAEDDLAKSIYQGLSSNPDLVCVENVITHKNCIDDAYYNTDKQHLYILVGNDILQVPCDEKTGYAALAKLAKEDGFATVTKDILQESRGRRTEVPADVVQMSRATLLFYSEAKERTLVVAAHQNFPISLDETQARDLFDAIEKKGLEEAKASTAKMPWTQGLKDALAALPTETVDVPPSLTDTGREYLFNQVVGQSGDRKPMPKPQEDFSAAAAPVKEDSRFTYPAKRALPKPPRP